MIEIGIDQDGDRHLIPDGEDPALHKADTLCGCNPDPYIEYGDGDERGYWWGHHTFGGRG